MSEIGIKQENNIYNYIINHKNKIIKLNNGWYSILIGQRYTYLKLDAANSTFTIKNRYIHVTYHGYNDKYEELFNAIYLNNKHNIPIITPIINFFKTIKILFSW